MVGLFSPGVIFFPINQPKYVNVFVEFPVGTDIETTNEFAVEINNKVDKIIEPYSDIVESVISNVGQGTADPNDPSAIGEGESPNKARITINFVEIEERGGILSSDVMEEIRAGVRGYPGVTIYC